MFYTIPVSKEPQVATTPIGAKSVRYIFFENKNDGIFTFKEQQDDVISISIGGRQICRNLIVLPFCTNTPYGINKMPWQKVALEANINVDFSEIKISATGGENDYNVVFVCSDEPVDESRGFDFFEAKKVPLIRPMLNSEARALVDAAWEKAKAAKLDELNEGFDEKYAAWESEVKELTDNYIAWQSYDLALAEYSNKITEYYHQKNIYEYKLAFFRAFNIFNSLWKNQSGYDTFEYEARSNGIACGFFARYSTDANGNHCYQFGRNGDATGIRTCVINAAPGNDLTDKFANLGNSPMGDDSNSSGCYPVDYEPTFNMIKPTEPAEPATTRTTATEVADKKAEEPQRIDTIPADTEMTLNFDNLMPGLVYPEEGQTLLYGEYNSSYRISISIWLQNKYKNPFENFWGKENELLFDKEPQFMFAYSIVKPKGADIVMSSDIKLNLTIAGASHEIIPPGTDLDILSANDCVPFRDALLTFDPSDGVKRSLSVTVRENAKTAQRGHITKLPAIEYWTLYLLFGYKKII